MTDESRHSTAVTGMWSPPVEQPNTGIGAVAASDVEIRSSDGEEPTTSPKHARAGLRFVTGGHSEGARHLCSPDEVKTASGLPESSKRHAAENGSSRHEDDRSGAPSEAGATTPATKAYGLSPEQQNSILKELKDFDLLAYVGLQMAEGIHFPTIIRDNMSAVAVAMTSLIIDMKPRDNAEMLLLAQAQTLHDAAMRCFKMAALPEQTMEGIHRNLNLAQKLARNYALHLETLDRRRGRGQQTVRVEHVTVNAGGQAIVGNVSHPKAGEGDDK